MSKPKFQRRRTPLPPGAIIALSSGRDYFAAFGDGSPRLNQQTLDRMRSAWRDDEVRDAVRQRQLDRWGTATSFAEVAFGDQAERRITPDQVDAVRDKTVEVEVEALAKRNESLSSAAAEADANLRRGKTPQE